jgi:hypothetical protein
MVRARSRRSVWLQLVGIVAAALLTGCGGGSAIPAQTAFAPGALSNLGRSVPDAKAAPKCKGQKDTAKYASVAKETMNPKGGSFCIPAFGGWGGELQYPSVVNKGKYTVAFTSSTKQYTGGKFPPPSGPFTNPIFSLQIAFSGFPGWTATMPKGKPFVSAHLKAHKPYTIVLYNDVIVTWLEINMCYQVAKKSAYGAELTGVGDALFKDATFKEMDGALEIYEGQLSSTKC